MVNCCGLPMLLSFSRKNFKSSKVKVDFRLPVFFLNRRVKKLPDGFMSSECGTNSVRWLGLLGFLFTLKDISGAAMKYKN
jgi:hypothetical protein